MASKSPALKKKKGTSLAETGGKKGGPYRNIEEAKKYIDWITSEEAKKLINNYRVNGKQLFFFNHN